MLNQQILMECIFPKPFHHFVAHFKFALSFGFERNTKNSLSIYNLFNGGNPIGKCIFERFGRVETWLGIMAKVKSIH